VEAAEAINPFVGRNIADTTIDEGLKVAFEEQLEKERAKAEKEEEKKKPATKRPPSPSSEKQPSKKPPSASGSEQNSNEELVEANPTAAPMPKAINTNTCASAPTVATATSEEEMDEIETVTNEEYTSNQRSQKERKEYTKHVRDVTIGKDTIRNVPNSLEEQVVPAAKEG
jgi:hypothetical protein